MKLTSLSLFVVSVVGVVSMTAILSNYPGLVKVSVGSIIHLQVEGNAHRK
jgi:hypothetical protein